MGRPSLFTSNAACVSPASAALVAAGAAVSLAALGTQAVRADAITVTVSSVLINLFFIVSLLKKYSFK